jgi:DNA repair protein SbcC/Rad50
MRLHHLSITAFGPFPGTERVDFDALNGAGLFLLCGATGAGKTSILDAVCFALYGTVPGARGVKVLKSHHAEDLARPEVVLEFSVRDRRFVVRRSPEWSRPKLRGTGTRTEKASASLTEITPDGGRMVTHRAAEVGLTVSELIGMQASQFQQVAMLPQGEFQRFLQATSTERHDVLQHLFRTARFARIEDWVQEHSRRLREASSSGEHAVRRLLATIADRAGAEPPEGLSDRVDPDSAMSWARHQAAQADHELADAVAAHEAADQHVETCREELERRTRTAELVRRRDLARTRLSALAEEAQDAAEHRERLGADIAAAACLPMLTLLDRAKVELTTAATERDRHLDMLRRSLSEDSEDSDDLDDSAAEHPDPQVTDVDIERLAELELKTRAMLVRVEGALPTVGAFEADRAALAEAEATLERKLARRQQLAQAGDVLPGRRQEASEQLETLRAAAAGIEALQLRLAASRDRTAAAARVVDIERQLAAHRDLLRDNRDAAADARDLVQTLTQRRLDGYAAELAGALKAGAPCQVCGSVDHPAPAVPAADHVGADEQDRAQQVLDDATARVEAARAEVDRLAQEAADLRRRTEGRDLDATRAEQDAVRADLEEARRAAAALPGLEQQVARLEEEADRCRVERAQLDLDVARLTEAIDSRRRSTHETWTTLSQAVPGLRRPADLDGLAARLSTRLTGLEALRAAQVQYVAAASRVQELESETRAACAAAGFTAVSGVRAALLTAEERARLEQLVEARTHDVAAAEAVLAEPELRRLEDAPAPDVKAAQQELLRAEARKAELSRTMHQHEQRAAALCTQVDQLQHELDTWAPTLAGAERAESMSKLVRGMGSDNQLQMRLSAYVLATRLDQVLAAANERLSHMRDQRYVLQRTARAHRRGTQAGLGLEVLDQWTGDSRDPATLSGGETFVVSLALALGLADVVTQEAGGTEIETLFVDEGFGTLDPDTLDDVMDRLDALRAGGRSVGVVSHVTELRSRIPAQVHVRKTPTGSSIRVG